jgi:hypothetical protein
LLISATPMYYLTMIIEQQRGAIPITLDRPRILFFDTPGTWLLVEKYEVGFLRALYSVKASPTAKGREQRVDLIMNDVDVLAYFLWAGLQAELRDTDEALTEAEAAALIRPWTVVDVFNAVVGAVSGREPTRVVPTEREKRVKRPQAEKAIPRRTSRQRSAR